MAIGIHFRPRTPPGTKEQNAKWSHKILARMAFFSAYFAKYNKKKFAKKFAIGKYVVQPKETRTEVNLFYDRGHIVGI